MDMKREGCGAPRFYMVEHIEAIIGILKIRLVTYESDIRITEKSLSCKPFFVAKGALFEHVYSRPIFNG